MRYALCANNLSNISIKLYKIGSYVVSSSADSLKSKGPMILIVDDDLDVTTSVSSILELEGFRWAVCHSGLAAFEFVKREIVDLILLDVGLPDVNGKDVALMIRKVRFIPIIMLSGMKKERDKIEGLRFGDDYVTKPFSFEELIARINALLRIGELQNELLLSKERYQCLYENIPEMCISLDKDRDLCDCNTMFWRLCGCRKENLIGRNVTEFFHPKDHDLLTFFLLSLEPQQIHENTNVFQLAYTDGNGHPIYVTTRAICLGEHQTGLYIILAMKDVSLNLKLQKQQQLTQQQLYRSARMASIGTLASGIAHELNNPLTAVLGFSDALIQQMDNHEPLQEVELKQYLTIIHREALRCRDVIENLSKFSRDYELKNESVSLNTCLQSSIALLNVRAQKKNIRIVNMVNDIILVSANGQKIVQVLVNLLSNSIDFCDNGCTVTISVENPLSIKEPVRLKVIDNGPGISEANLQKIFDPFFTTKEVGKGIGLGMSISHKLMEESNGSIDVFSREGEGTTVILEIPRE